MAHQRRLQPPSRTSACSSLGLLTAKPLQGSLGGHFEVWSRAGGSWLSAGALGAALDGVLRRCRHVASIDRRNWHKRKRVADLPDMVGGVRRSSGEQGPPPGECCQALADTVQPIIGHDGGFGACAGRRGGCWEACPAWRPALRPADRVRRALRCEVGFGFYSRRLATGLPAPLGAVPSPG